MFRVCLEDTTGVKYDGCNVDVKQGDRVGCGFEPTNHVDVQSGIPCAYQTLMIYFTVNGRKVIFISNGSKPVDVLECNTMLRNVKSSFVGL